STHPHRTPGTSYQTTRNRPCLSHQRRTSSRKEAFFVRFPDYGRGRTARTTHFLSRHAAGQIPLHPRRRIPGHQHRPTPPPRTPRRRSQKHFCRRRQRPGHLPLSRRLLRQLSTFPRAFCGLEARRRFHAVPRFPHGKLSLHAQHSPRRHAGHRAKHGQRRLPAEIPLRHSQGRRENPHFRTRARGSRGGLHRIGTPPHPRHPTQVAGPCRALPPTFPSQRTRFRTFPPQNSVRHFQSLHPRSSARQRRDRLFAPHRLAV